MTLRTTTDKATGVALLTLDRPERLNAIDLPTAEQLTLFWQELRYDDAVRAVVVTGAGERAFCTGLDRDAAGAVPQPNSPYTIEDPLLRIGPKSNDCWKPLIAAVNGMACGGAFYLLGEAEFLVADPAATFFDPHTSYGMVSAFESILMAQRMPYGEATRMALLGTAERMSARRAHEVGLVSEVTEPGESVAAAVRCAEIVAACPAEAVQGTVRACWAAREATRTHALAYAPHLISLGNQPRRQQEELFASRRQSGHRTR